MIPKKSLNCGSWPAAPSKPTSGPWLTASPNHIDYKIVDGIRKRVKGFKDKTATVQLAARLEKQTELAHAGIVDTSQVYNRAKAVIDNCRFAFMADLSASKVQAYLADCRRAGLGIRTSNFYLQTIKQFCIWLVIDNRTGENPLAHLKGQNPKTDVRRQRRTITAEELDYLIQTTSKGLKHHKMTGQQRAMLYLLAVHTGFRANELSSLTWRSFNFCPEAPTVTVLTAYSKHPKMMSNPSAPMWLSNLPGGKPNDTRPMAKRSLVTLTRQKGPACCGGIWRPPESPMRTIAAGYSIFTPCGTSLSAMSLVEEHRQRSPSS